MKASGRLIGGRVIVPDVREAESLYFGSYYGTPIGEEKPKEKRLSSPIALSTIEALYLVERSLLSVEAEGRELSADDLRSLLSRRERAMYVVYKDLRDAGLIVRSGIKFGADFTVYRIGPGLEHAPYIVHVVEISDEIDPIDIVRAGRLSHSVRKVFSLALSRPGGEAEYLTLRWVRP